MADMEKFTLHDLQCLDAVVRAGGFQAAADKLHRSHPAVFAAVAKLERQLGFALLDRSGYRVVLTKAGKSFHQRSQALLTEMTRLSTHAAQLALGQESQLRIVIGDLCPGPQVLALLATFFASCPDTRMHLLFEAVSGPMARLENNDADLIFHRIDKTDPGIEWIDLCPVKLVPVIAPALLATLPAPPRKPEDLRQLTQCIMRDTAGHDAADSFFVVEGAHHCTVPDQAMKREVILQKLGWGHLPDFLIREDLAHARLVSIASRHFPGRREALVAARIASRAQGPVATRLWQYIQEQAPALRRAVLGPA